MSRRRPHEHTTQRLYSRSADQCRRPIPSGREAGASAASRPTMSRGSRSTLTHLRTALPASLRCSTPAAGRPAGRLRHVAAGDRGRNADELAAAAELLVGKTRRTPTVVGQGLDQFEESPGSDRELVRPSELDLFRSLVADMRRRLPSHVHRTRITRRMRHGPSPGAATRSYGSPAPGTCTSNARIRPVPVLPSANPGSADVMKRVRRATPPSMHALT